MAVLQWELQTLMPLRCERSHTCEQFDIPAQLRLPVKVLSLRTPSGASLSHCELHINRTGGVRFPRLRRS